MKIFPTEPQVDLYNEGFEDNDILDRASVGKSLSDLVNRIEDPIVVALDGGWGTGKTYFLKRWVGEHNLYTEDASTTFFFDAFANDYLSDPLPALVSALSERFTTEDKEAVERIKSAAFKIAKPLARAGLAMATFGMTEVLAPVGDAAAKALSEEASQSIENYWAQESGRRVAIEEFRSALTELVAAQTDSEGVGIKSGARVVIVVDELDRCRPDYALEVLEVIKHFFSIPGVSFVLGANLNALENSVKARYGAEIDATAYLRKFIDVSLSLPMEIGSRHDRKPVTLVYLDRQVKGMGIPSRISSRLREHINVVLRNNNVSIRDVGKILSSVSIASVVFLEGDNIPHGWLDVAITLLVSKVVRPDLYPAFLDATITEKELEEYFDASFVRRNRKIDDESNPEFDHYTWIQFGSWKYLVQNGDLQDEKPSDVKGFRGIFSSWGYEEEPRHIPSVVNRDWLDLFTATSG